MKIEAEGNDIVLKQIYSGVFLETSEGNRIGICMRDDTFEINVLPKGAAVSTWHRVNMQTRNIIKEERVDVVPRDTATNGSDG